MENIIWNEMYYVKKNEEYITLYISFLKSIKKAIDFIVLIATSTGIVSWTLNSQENKVIVGISLFIAGIFQVIEIIQTKFIASDEYLDNVIELKLQWAIYFDKLEKQLLDIIIDKKDNSIILKSYNKLNPLKQTIVKKDGEIKLWIIEFLNKKANILTNNFMKRYYE